MQLRVESEIGPELPSRPRPRTARLAAVGARPFPCSVLGHSLQAQARQQQVRQLQDQQFIRIELIRLLHLRMPQRQPVLHAPGIAKRTPRRPSFCPTTRSTGSHFRWAESAIIKPRPVAVFWQTLLPPDHRVHTHRIVGPELRPGEHPLHSLLHRIIHEFADELPDAAPSLGVFTRITNDTFVRPKSVGPIRCVRTRDQPTGMIRTRSGTKDRNKRISPSSRLFWLLASSPRGSYATQRHGSAFDNSRRHQAYENPYTRPTPGDDQRDILTSCEPGDHTGHRVGHGNARVGNKASGPLDLVLAPSERDRA